MAITLAFDIGYASIGWCVLSADQPNKQDPEFLGTGVVTFPTDDCLASQRRDLRRTRRHIRSTRMRIERMKCFLIYRGVLTRDDLDKPGHPAPFLLAAAALQGHRTLSAWELWTVLRWYAHNRGYDGNSLWARGEEESEDTEKVSNAWTLMETHQTKTMCETVCACLGLDLQEHEKRISSALPYKTLNAAYPRKIVQNEVLTLLQAHLGKIKGLDEKTLDLLFTSEALSKEDRDRLKVADIKLPKRYHGGLLFGQLVPRFDNRIISRCPITWAKTYDEARDLLPKADPTLLALAWGPWISVQKKDKLEIDEWQKLLMQRRNLLSVTNADSEKIDDTLARKLADKFAKVPAAKSTEFLEYRFARILANLKADGKPIDKELRQQLWDLAKIQGSITHSDIKKAVEQHCGNVPTNLEAFFTLHPDSEKSLVLDPVMDELRKASKSSNSTFFPYWKLLTDKAREEVCKQWSKSKEVSFKMLWEDAERTPDLTSAIEANFQKESKSDKVKKSYPNFDAFLKKKKAGPNLKELGLTGRAPYARPVLLQVVEEVKNGWDATKANKITDPENGENKPVNGVLYDLGIPSSRVRELQKERPLDQLTNNHLVRHRMLILGGDPDTHTKLGKTKRHTKKAQRCLIDDIIDEFVDGDPNKISHVIIEVARELREFSGKDITEIKEELTNRLKNFKSAVDKLREDAPHLPLSSTLIRKCRIAMDQGWRCPYTGIGPWDAKDLPNLTLDHIIPHSTRKTDALHAIVITPEWVNKAKGKRTATQFIEDMADDSRFVCPNKFKKWAEDHGPQKRPNKETFRASKKFPHIDDAIRCHNRRKLLLIKSFEDKELGFTEGQLTQTSQLLKLAMLSVKNKIPNAPCVPIPGVINATIRKSWNMLGCLGSPDVCGNDVMRWIRDYDNRSDDWSIDSERKYPLLVRSKLTEIKLKKGKKEEQLPLGVLRCASDECGALLAWPTLADCQTAFCTISKATCPACDSVLRKVPKPKEDIRGITHLHHALDAATLALAHHYFPLTRYGENQAGTLWRAMLNRRKTSEEISLLLSTKRFKACSRSDKDGKSQPDAQMLDLPAGVKNALAKSLAESRVMQHIPADRSGTKAELLTWGIVAIIGENALIIQRPNRGLLELDANSTQRRWKDKPPTKEAVKLLKEHGHHLGAKERRMVERGIFKLTTEKLTRLLGPASPENGGKLAAIRGALVIGGNFAIALMASSPILIPFHHVHQTLASLTASNGGNMPRLIRIGTLIKVPKGTWKGIWRVISVMNSEAYGISVDLARPHALKKAKGNAKVPDMIRDGLEILPSRYTGRPVTDL